MGQIYKIQDALLHQRQEKKKRPVCLDGPKFFTRSEIRLLRKTVREKADADFYNNRKTAIREWMLIDLLTCSGLRASEACNLQIQDLQISYGKSAIHVRNGKGNVSATIQIPAGLKTHLRSFIKWKEKNGEPIEPDSFLFQGQRGQWTRQAVSQIVKKYLRLLGLWENGKAVHALRHSFATQLYQKSKDLRLVQKMLRHQNIQTTTIYADISSSQVRANLKSLW